MRLRLATCVWVSLHTEWRKPPCATLIPICAAWFSIEKTLHRVHIVYLTVPMILGSFSVAQQLQVGPRSPHCWGLCITPSQDTPGRSPLNEWWARRRDRYLHNTQQKQETNIPALSGIRARNPRNWAPSHPRHQWRPSPWTPLTLWRRTAPLTFKRCILYIYSTNIGTQYFKHGIYSPFFLFKMQFVS